MTVIPETYTLLVADDEPDVHALTRLALKAMHYKDRPLEIVSVESGAAAVKYLERHPDTAVVLMDVVMESDHAGLEACNQIRQQLENDTVRLLLRTGQPGQAPERKVIENYEVDGYLAKAEMTHTRLFTAVRTALKTYTELKTVKWLEQILTFLNQSSTGLQFAASLQETLEEALMIAQEIVPSDGAILHIQLQQALEDEERFTVNNGLAFLEAADSSLVDAQLQRINQAFIDSPFAMPQAFENGYYFPLGLPPEVGTGWLFINNLQLKNQLAESAVFKAIGLLLQQTSSAVCNLIIREQAAELEADILELS